MKWKLLFSIGLLFVVATVHADIDIDSRNFGSENITQPAKRTPFGIDSHLDVIGESEITKGVFKKDKIKFAEAEVELGSILYYDPVYTEGARASLSYSAAYLRWKGNPYFDQDHFNLLSLNLSGFSMRLNDWFWRTQVTINCDTSEWCSKYTSYDILLWGRYTLYKDIGLHFGFFAETGLQMDRIYPILGFDWQINQDWKLSLVYPMDIALVYKLTKSWSAAFAGRLFNSRFRVNSDQCSAKSLLRYTNSGAEFAVKYDTDTMSVNIHAGVTLGGTYRIADSRNHHARHYHFGSGAYVGAEADVKF